MLMVSDTISLDVLADALHRRKGEVVAMLADLSEKKGLPIRIVDEKVIVNEEDVGKLIDEIIAQFGKKKLE